jgi:hypothetical protein
MDSCLYPYDWEMVRTRSPCAPTESYQALIKFVRVRKVESRNTGQTKPRLDCALPKQRYKTVYQDNMTIWLLFSFAASLCFLSTVSAQSVKPNKSCYTFDEDMTFKFVNKAIAKAGDWIGVFTIPQPSSSTFVSESAWVRLCGSQTCSAIKLNGSVKIRDALPLGKYKAIISRDENEPYRSYATSAVFEVRNSCSGSGTVPTPVQAQGPAPTPVASNNQLAAQHLKQARDEIEGMVRNDAALGATFLRMIFHDCVGGCDGTC